MYLSDDDQMREYYRQNENAYWKGVLATAKAESKAEGRAEGIAEGEARGEARGIAKERKNLLEAARTMLSEGMAAYAARVKRIETSCSTGPYFLAGPFAY